MEEQEQQEEAVVSEQPDIQSQEQEEPKMVPLAALQAERKKRQELEFLMKQQNEQKEVEEEDPTELVEKKTLHENTAMTKRDILETLFQDMKPEAVQKINKYLKPILEKKPWLAATVDSAQNRYARAYEIVEDYMHLVEPKSERTLPKPDGNKIVQNANKPRSPMEIGKSAQPTGVEFLKQIQGKKEFREYRKNLLQGGA